eukprot:jgi/Mesen1/4630/ME000239S03903
MGSEGPASFQVKSVSIPQQKTYENRVFPLVLSPAINTGTFHQTEAHASPDQHNGEPSSGASSPGSIGILDVEAWVRQQKIWIENQLLEYGAVLLRGFPVESAADFNRVVEAFEWEELPYVGGAAPRTNVVGRVFTSNESPPDQKIPFHHEMAQVPEYPAKLFFFCEVPPAEGGETPILLSHEVVQTMEARWPQFVRELREKGLVYTRVLGEGDDTTSAIGRGWQSTARQLGVTLEWLPNGSVKTVSGPLPALRRDERTGREAWFNSMVAAFTGWQDSRNTAEKTVTFGDGTPLPREAVLDCSAIMQAASVAVPWQRGDVLLIDNHTVQHSRRAFRPPRRVLASLAK